MEPPSANSDVESIRGFLEASSLEDRVLQPDKTLTIWLSCKPKGIGLHTSVVHFDVGDDRIERVVFLLAEDDVSQSLASNRPYSKVPRKKHFNVGEYVAGSRPTKATTQGFKYRLPQYAIPNNIRELVESKQIHEAITKGLTSIQETKIRSKRTQTSQSLKNENVMDDVTKAIREMSFESDPERSSIIEK
ncbi:hypothetical protein HHK36_031609 [Tetracentron sinense]|uniref:Uncharacterized protein n=1 Tax=Tetracentron sinense TaxID=13715 RepID=A0A835D0B1_TETSI|nr:hypothetical protein HHK36_031609 [Tetracentron sinense]